MIEPKSCVQELISMECIDRSVLILYPYGLSNEPILKDNIPKMTKVIREYIKEYEMYRKCVDTIPNLIWDSQKISMQNEADEHQRKADELAEKMNEGISPYAWYVKGRFNGEIGGFHYNVDNIVYLEKNNKNFWFPMEVKICSIDGKHILNIFLKSVVGIYAQLDMAKNHDKHILWIYFGTKRH